MQPITSPTALRSKPLDSLEVATFFVSITKTKHLMPFMGQERSLAEAARLLEISKSLMAYWVKQMLELGLIEHRQTEKRGRHVVPLYSATADVFMIALERVPAASDEALFEIFTKVFAEDERAAVIHAARSNLSQWFITYRLRDGRDCLDIAAHPTESEELKMVNRFDRIRLTQADAAQLRLEMLALLSRYKARTSSDGDEFLYKLLLVEALS